MNVQSLVDRAGGVTRLAALLHISHSTVCEWKRNGFIPGSRVGQISAALKLSPEWLVPLVKPPPGWIVAPLNSNPPRPRRKAA